MTDSISTDGKSLLGTLWTNPKTGKRCKVSRVEDWSMQVHYESGASRWVITDHFLATHEEGWA